MITHPEFAALRFADHLPPGAKLTEEDGYEWMNGIWHYQGIGFSWFGSAMEEPGATTCLQLFADEVPAHVMARIMNRLGLPLRFGMDRAAIEGVLGNVFRTQHFADDRITCEFLTPGPEHYYLDCTILHEGGSVAFSLLRGDLYERYRTDR